MCWDSVTTAHTTSSGASIEISRSMRCGTMHRLHHAQPVVAPR
jgi:hypothetical protein